MKKSFEIILKWKCMAAGKKKPLVTWEYVQGEKDIESCDSFENGANVRQEVGAAIALIFQDSKLNFEIP